MASQKGKRVRLKDGAVLFVEEHDHAYLVRGPGIKWGPTIQQARLALFESLGRKKWTRIAAMPARPLHTSEIGDRKPCGAVALYFAIAAGMERVYKP